MQQDRRSERPVTVASRSDRIDLLGRGDIRSQRAIVRSRSSTPPSIFSRARSPRRLTLWSGQATTPECDHYSAVLTPQHDTDASLARPLREVAALNRLVAGKMAEVFGSIPIVPSIGNNDVAPHNIQKPGPSTVLDELHDAWHQFLPDSQHDLFVRDGYFVNEVIPDRLAVISLNTMWLFASNEVRGWRRLSDTAGGQRLLGQAHCWHATTRLARRSAAWAAKSRSAGLHHRSRTACQLVQQVLEAFWQDRAQLSGCHSRSALRTRERTS